MHGATPLRIDGGCEILAAHIRDNRVVTLNSGLIIVSAICRRWVRNNAPTLDEGVDGAS